jgi:hypothetical protein
MTTPPHLALAALTLAGIYLGSALTLWQLDRYGLLPK